MSFQPIVAHPETFMKATKFLAAARRSLTIVCTAIAASGVLASGMAGADEWGTIKGRFLYGGDAPSAAEIKADKDVEVCGKHKLVNEELAIGADKGVANVVVFVRDKAVKVHPDAAAEAKATKVVLDNKDCRFSPHVVVVQTGQPLIIKNSDTVGHNSNVATLKNPPSNSLIPAGGESSIPFANEEAIPAQVTCNIHPWMKGWVVVRPNPYAAVSAADGSFEIKNVPAGEVELQLWHEKAGYIGEISVGGKSEKIAKGRRKVKVEAAGTNLGDMVLAPGLFQK
jgi:plastocyanin